jgi:Spy/CpxP family protein refolding chaperone
MLNFRNSRIAIVALSGLLMAGTAGAVLAQPYTFAEQGQRGGRGGVTLEALTARLTLTDDQQAKIKPILADRDAQMTTLRGDQSASQEDRMAKMQKLNADIDGKINAVLTDSQKAEYKKMQAERMQRGPGGPGGGAPPAQ